MELLEFLKIILFGIVEGITEWLPISSTGHLLLLDRLCSLQAFQNNVAFKEMFTVVVQLGAIMAVIVLYAPVLWPVTRNKDKLILNRPRLVLWSKILVACIPAGVFGLLFDDIINRAFYSDSSYREVITIIITLILYGAVFILVERWAQTHPPRFNNLETMSYKLALYIGMFQILALIPGTSRSGATIIGAMLLGTSRRMAAEFTFLLAIPTMFGASFLKLFKYQFAFSGMEYAILLTGMLTAFLVSFACIRLLLRYIGRHNFQIFGWYRIILGCVLYFYFFVVL